MKKALLCSVPLLLALVLGTGMAIAGELDVVTLGAPQSTVKAPVCDSQQPVQAPTLDELLRPAVEPAGACPRIACGDGQFCNQDRDCTAAPGGVCIHFCPRLGCCSYPAP